MTTNTESVRELATEISQILRDEVAYGTIEGHEAGVILVNLLAKMVAHMSNANDRRAMVKCIVDNFNAAVQVELAKIANADKGTLQ